MKKENEYDVIIIGSGTSGATIARELSKQNKKVLILERGQDVPLKESLVCFASIADEVKLGDKLTTMRALATGGSSAMYFGVVNYPPLEVFSALGVDIGTELEEVKRELPIAPLPDTLLSEPAVKLRASASALGHAWNKHDLLIDLSKCNSDYTYAGLWRARSYVEDALRQGATLINRATVNKVLIDKGKAIGVEYTFKKNMFVSERRSVYGSKIVLAAGELASPQILRASGVEGIGKQGFFCNPGYAIYGLIPGMQARDGFVGSMGCVYGDGIELGDANVSRFLHKPMMLSKFKLRHLFSYPECIGIGVKVKDGYGGELKADGSFHKEFSQDDYAKLKKGEQEAMRILENAGAKEIFNFGITASGRVGGMVAIQEHLDSKFETQFKNLHVCDGSMIPGEMRGTPTLTLVCLAKYLAKQLASSL